MNSQRKRWAASLSLITPLWIASSAAVFASHLPCDQSLTRRIPERHATASAGRELAAKLAALNEAERDATISNELLSGNVPQFLRQLIPVAFFSPEAPASATTIILCVAADYLAVGADSDFLLAPLGLDAALLVASAFGFLLPTKRIVDAIYAHSAVTLRPQPLPASAAMRSMRYILQHNELVHAQRAQHSAPRGTLIAGHKKNVVLTNRLWTNLDRVAIYGWHQDFYRPIQPLSIARAHAALSPRANGEPPSARQQRFYGSPSDLQHRNPR